MVHVIVNWGGRIDYNLDRIYNLTKMMKNKGYEVFLVENNSSRQHWLSEHLGENLTIGNAQRHKSGQCTG